MEAQAESSASSVKMGQLHIRQFVDERNQYHQALILKERMQRTQKVQQAGNVARWADGDRPRARDRYCRGRSDDGRRQPARSIFKFHVDQVELLHDRTYRLSRDYKV